MANTDAPNGFIAVNQFGSSYNGETIRVVFAAADATAAFVGDLVTLTGTLDTTDNKTPTVEQADASDTLIFGVVQSFEQDPDDMSNTQRTASTRRFAYVHPATDDLYLQAQEDSVGGSIAAASAGLNVNFIVGTGSSVSGSGMEIDSSTVATTATLPLKLIRPANDTGNALGTNCKWLCKINNSALSNVTLGV